MISGALWESAIAASWSPDLKIKLSIATWVFYLVGVFGRLLAHQRGRKTALLSVLGFIMLASSYLGGRALG